MLPYSIDAELNESIDNLVQHRGNNILLARAFKRALFVTVFKKLMVFLYGSERHMPHARAMIIQLAQL